MKKDRTASFNETEAQQILARAAELEGAAGTRFTADDLRQIAATSDIDSHALERAMSEAGRGVVAGVRNAGKRGPRDARWRGCDQPGLRRGRADRRAVAFPVVTK